MKKPLVVSLITMIILTFFSIQRAKAEDFEDVVLDINYNHTKYAPPKLTE